MADEAGTVAGGCWIFLHAHTGCVLTLTILLRIAKGTHLTKPFFERTGCHGNGAQVGRGELGGTLHPRDGLHI